MHLMWQIRSCPHTGDMGKEQLAFDSRARERLKYTNSRHLEVFCDLFECNTRLFRYTSAQFGDAVIFTPIATMFRWMITQFYNCQQTGLIDDAIQTRMSYFIKGMVHSVH